MNIFNLIMFLVSIGSLLGLKLTGHSDPGTDQVLTGLAATSLGFHAGATFPYGGSK